MLMSLLSTLSAMKSPEHDHHFITLMMRAGEIQNAVAIEIRDKHFSGAPVTGVGGTCAGAKPPLPSPSMTKSFLFSATTGSVCPSLSTSPATKEWPPPGMRSGEDDAGL